MATPNEEVKPQVNTPPPVAPAASVPSPEEIMKAMFDCMQAKDKVINYLCQHATLPIASMKYLQETIMEENTICNKYNQMIMAKKGAQP